MRRWLRPSVRLTIRPAQEAYEVGQPIKVRVTVEARRDSDIRSASAYLVAGLWYGAPRVTVYPGGATYVSGPPPAVVRVSSVALEIPATIRAGDSAECEAMLPNLATTPSGGDKRAGRRIAYSVQARANLAGGRVARGAWPVRLLSPRTLHQEVEGSVMKIPKYQSGKCDLELDLSALHARPGQTLRGVLHVRPRHSVRARRVTVSLVRVETAAKQKPKRTVSYDDYRRRDVKFPFSITRRRKALMRTAHITLTGPYEIPFEVQLPGDATPTMLTHYLSMRWYVQATIAYGLFSQDACGRELNVYTGR